MDAVQVVITLDFHLLKIVDEWVREGKYPNRSQAIQAALRENVERRRRTRLARESAKLDPAEERAIAEE